MLGLGKVDIPRKSSTVIVVEDDTALREGLTTLFESVGVHVLSYESPAALLNAPLFHGLGCLLVDERLPGMGGIVLTEKLRQRGINMPFAVMTAYADVDTAVRAMKAGATEFVQKPFTQQDIVELVQRMLADYEELYFARRARTEIVRRVRKLSLREQAILRLVMRGNSNKDIGDTLKISHRTVETHRYNIMKKLDVVSVVSLLNTLYEPEALDLWAHLSG